LSGARRQTIMYNYVFAGKYNLKVESDGVVQRWIKESVSTPMLLYSL